MADLFTLIGLVLSVSGSTYAAIAGLHGHWGEGHKNQFKRLEYCRDHITENGTDETKKHCTRNCKWFHKGIRWWNIACLTPTLIFLLFSFIVSVHVMSRFYGSGDMSAVIPTVGPFYMHFLGAITIVDIVCIVVTISTHFLMNWMAGGLESGVQQTDEILQKSLSPVVSDTAVGLPKPHSGNSDHRPHEKNPKVTHSDDVE